MEPKNFISYQLYIVNIGSGGGGASSRAMALCLSEPGSMDLTFFGNQKCYQSICAGRRQYLKRTGHRKCYIFFLLLSCFLSFKNYIWIVLCQWIREKKRKSPQKRPGKAHLKKNIVNLVWRILWSVGPILDTFLVESEWPWWPLVESTWLPSSYHWKPVCTEMTGWKTSQRKACKNGVDGGSCRG